MQSAASCASDPDVDTGGIERGGAAIPRARRGEHRSFASRIERTSHMDGYVSGEPRAFEDEQLDDLVHSWRRLTDPRLKKLAIQIIQSMED